MTYVETARRRGVEGMITGNTRKAAAFTVRSMS